MTARDFLLPSTANDFVELYVGNARQSAYDHRAAFGMTLIAYNGPETGRRDASGLRRSSTTQDPARPDHTTRSG